MQKDTAFKRNVWDGALVILPTLIVIAVSASLAVLLGGTVWMAAGVSLVSGTLTFIAANIVVGTNRTLTDVQKMRPSSRL